MKTPRNRIKRHVAVRAGDLMPHELNPRVHGAAQNVVYFAFKLGGGFFGAFFGL